MKITTDNMSVDNNINTYKCPVICDGTVLLLPSQVKKYLGSYNKHKLIGFGILLPKDSTVNVISEEIITGNKWLLVVYNNKYYYTPKEYVDTSKIITNNLSINTTYLENTLKTVSMSNNTKTSTDSASVTRESGPFTSDNCQIAEALTDIDLRSYPSPTSSVDRVLRKGEKCIVQSIWKNNEYNSKWFCSATFNPGGGVYGKYVNNNNVKLTTPKMCYSIIINDTTCNYMNGKSYSRLRRGDLTWPKYQDWNKGIHVNVTQGSGGGLLTYSYPASSASPIADSSDMINKEYLGELTVNKTATVYAFHRKSNYSKTSDQKVSLDNISLNSLKYAVTKNAAIKKILEHGFNDPKKGPTADNITNAELLSPGTTMVVTNYTTISGNKYYIGFKKTGSSNGAVYYIALYDGGVEYINYNKYPPNSVDTSLNIPTDNEDVKYIDIEEVNINTSKYASDTRNLNDPSKITKEHYTNDKDNNNNVYGLHLGIGDNSDYNVPGILQNVPEIPPEYNGYSVLLAAEKYNLSAEKPFDTKHLTHINRFHLPTNNSGLATKSFIFITRPDLNLYHESEDGSSINTWAMNPDLKRLPGFKYIARMRGTPDAPGIGTKIMNSLEYWGLNENTTPWLSVLSNQAAGYSVIDRELDITEMGETFHGNKVIYAEPTFKHKIGGTVQIPFIERRDLTLYYTLRMWVEYIQAVSVGFCSPRLCHKRDFELDYAVSLFYITTDETMENILYWEKLTGLIPLTVPDSFFEWSEGNGAREMRYSINFAYSFRTVMDELHLAEINNLYQRYKDTNPTGMPIVPKNYYDYNFDNSNNELLARVSSFYADISGDDNSYVSNLMNDKSALEKYYYGGIIVDNDIKDSYIVKGSTDGAPAPATSTAKFLPNYNMHTKMHGIPYVKGPFIEHDPDAQKYKLRWV